MCAVTFVLPDVSIAGLQWFILIPHRSHRPIDSHSKPYLHREKRYRLDLEQELPSLLQSYELQGKQPSLILVTSYDMP